MFGGDSTACLHSEKIALTPTSPLQYCPTSMLNISADGDFHEEMLSCEKREKMSALSSLVHHQWPFFLPSFFTLVTGLYSAGCLRPNVIPDQHCLLRVLRKKKKRVDLVRKLAYTLWTILYLYWLINAGAARQEWSLWSDHLYPPCMHTVVRRN